MRVYVSGAITGVKHADKLFARAEEKLKLEGYEVVSSDICFWVWNAK
jgi:hypothetical protein